MRVILLSFALFAAGCATGSDTRPPDAPAEPTETTPPPAIGSAVGPATGSEPVVILERTPCEGTCPAYVVSAYADGRVVFEGYNFVEQTGLHRSRVEPSVVAALVARAAAIGHASLPEHLTDRECEMVATDHPSAVTTVRTASGTSTVARDGGCSGYDGEDVLPGFEDQIDTALGTAAFVGEG